MSGTYFSHADIEKTYCYRPVSVNNLRDAVQINVQIRICQKMIQIIVQTQIIKIGYILVGLKHITFSTLQYIFNFLSNYDNFELFS